MQGASLFVWFKCGPIVKVQLFGMRSMVEYIYWWIVIYRYCYCFCYLVWACTIEGELFACQRVVLFCHSTREAAVGTAKDGDNCDDDANADTSSLAMPSATAAVPWFCCCGWESSSSGFVVVVLAASVAVAAVVVVAVVATIWTVRAGGGAWTWHWRQRSGYSYGARNTSMSGCKRPSRKL